MTYELGLQEWLSFFEVRIKQIRQRQQRQRSACIFHKWWVFPRVVGVHGLRVRGLGLLFPRPECTLTDQLCRSLKRVQNKEEDVSGGRTEAGHCASSSRKAGEHRWLLRAWLCICSGRFPHPPGWTLSTGAGGRCLQQFNGKKKKKGHSSSGVTSSPSQCPVKWESLFMFYRGSNWDSEPGLSSSNAQKPFTFHFPAHHWHSY